MTDFTNTVYVTTSDGALGEIIIDGDVAVLTCDWAHLDPVQSGDEIAERIGLRDGLPLGLINAVIDDIKAAGWDVTIRPEPGPDGTWTYVTFVDQTWASDGVESSGATVVYHDWSLWLADLAIGIDHDPEWLDDRVAEAEQLGPKGRETALAEIETYRRATETNAGSPTA